MNASGPSGVGAADAMFRVQKISDTRQLHGERDPNANARAKAEPEATVKVPSRSETVQTSSIRYGLWRHAPFVAQIIGQILPQGNDHERLARVTYGDKRAITSTIDTQV
jgi:hypothetical protein